MHLKRGDGIIKTMINYSVVHSSRRTLALEITRDCRIIVRAPYHCSDETIKRLIIKKEKWLTQNLKRQQERIGKAPPPTEPEEIEALKSKAKDVIPPKVKYYAKQMGVVPTAVKITTARTRYGSCSGKDSLCFSCFLMQYPDEAVDLVVVHELCHIHHKNHATGFYEELASILPDWRERKKLLNE